MSRIRSCILSKSLEADTNTALNDFVLASLVTEVRYGLLPQTRSEHGFLWRLRWVARSYNESLVVEAAGQYKMVEGILSSKVSASIGCSRRPNLATTSQCQGIKAFLSFWTCHYSFRPTSIHASEGMLHNHVFCKGSITTRTWVNHLFLLSYLIAQC